MTAALTARGEAMRRALIDAAAAELIAHGGSAELATIAGRAGCSTGLPYRYFGSKSGLIAAVVDDFFDRFDDRVFAPALVEHGAWPARERVRVQLLVDYFWDEPLAPIVLAMLTGDRDVIAAQKARLDRQTAAAADNIRRGQAEGAIPARVDADLAAALVMGGLREGLVAAIARTPRANRASVTAELQRFVAAVLQLRSA